MRDTCLMPSKRRSGRASRPSTGRPLSETLHTVEDWRGEDWAVRRITGSTSTKAYRCPGCDHLIRPATPHVVVWPLEASLQEFAATKSASGLGERRHWHTTCWDGRSGRSAR